MGDAVVITAMTAGETTDTDARLRELIAEALHTATRDATRAVALATEAEQLAVALGDDASRAEAIYALGRSLAMSSKYPAALEAYARALALCEAHGFTTHLPALLHAQGRIYRNMGDGAEAFRLFTRGLALAREAGDRIREASILADLGVLYAMFDVFETALDLQGQALALARAVPDFPDLGYLVQALGHTYRMQGDALLDEGDRTAAEAAHDTALLLLTEALALAQAEGERQLVAMCGGDLGIIALARGDSVRCRELLRVGDAVVAQLGADRFRGDYFYGLGMVEAVEGNYHAALVELERARFTSASASGPLSASCTGTSAPAMRRSATPPVPSRTTSSSPSMTASPHAKRHARPPCSPRSMSSCASAPCATRSRGCTTAATSTRRCGGKWRMRGVPGCR